MAKRLTVLLVALLALGLVVSGCGDDDKDKASDEKTTTQAAPAAGAPETEGSQTEEDSAATGVPSSPETKKAVEACKKQANANTQISANAKKKIGEVCEEAGSGDADGAVKATREACEIIIKDTAPAGAAQKTALDACKQSTTTP